MIMTDNAMTASEKAAMKALANATHGIRSIGVKVARLLIGRGYVREVSLSPKPVKGLTVMLTIKGKSWLSSNG